MRKLQQLTFARPALLHAHFICRLHTIQFDCVCFVGCFIAMPAELNIDLISFACELLLNRLKSIIRNGIVIPFILPSVASSNGANTPRGGVIRV
jgi:hypothetical protein